MDESLIRLNGAFRLGAGIVFGVCIFPKFEFVDLL